jgi:hypothetical protein
LRFHIIYTPNSTKYLIHFLSSLLEHTSYTYCLVSNGCSLKERAILQKTANQNERLSYYCYPTNEMQIHGKVLTHLQARCQEAYFCFMDSDIFATASLPDLEAILTKEKLTGLFSCMPLWVKKSEYVFKANFKGMVGTFNEMENSTCIGSTYFAIYKNEDLNQIIQHYGVCFDECARTTLPIDIQQELTNLDYPQTGFDTGKVINLLLNKHHFGLKNIEISELCHIGGTSYETTYQSQVVGTKQRLKKWLLNTPLKIIFNAQLEKRQTKGMQERYKNAPKEEYQINYNQRVLHRNVTRQHFLKLYLGLVNEQDLPKVPKFQDKEIAHNVAEAHKMYINNFKNSIIYQRYKK